MNDKLSAYNARRSLDQERKKDKKRQMARTKPEFQNKAKSEGRCRCCVMRKPPERIDPHHIVHRSKLRGMGIDVRDNLDNSMALCRDCHTRYHAGKLKFRRGMLTTSEIDFIITYAGAGWLDKVYPERANERPVRNRQGRPAPPSSSFRAAEAASRLGLRTGDDSSSGEDQEEAFSKETGPKED